MSWKPGGRPPGGAMVLVNIMGSLASGLGAGGIVAVISGVPALPPPGEAETAVAVTGAEGGRDAVVMPGGGNAAAAEVV